MAALALTLAAFACGDPDADAARTTDTTGRWRVDAEPMLSIGVVEGASEYQFTRPNRVARLQDGRVLVAEAGEKQLRFYDAEGRFLHSTGGDGEGPGEFRMLGGAWLFGGDSILVSDPALGRISIFTSTGEFVRSYLLDAVPGVSPHVLDVLGEDGALIAQPLQEGEILQITDGVRRDTIAISIVAPDGELERRVDRFPANEMFGSGAYFGTRAFGARSLLAAGRDAFYWASTDSFHIHRVSRDGSREQIVARDVPHEPVTQADQDEWREETTASASGAGSDFRVRFAQAMTFPETKPLLSALRVDREGNVWARSFGPSEEPGHWLVFDAGGAALGELDLPAGFAPQDIGDDWILGVARDESDVPMIRMLRLHRGEAS